MSGTLVTASTSVILVDTATNLTPNIVYFPYISTVGRIITVRDNDGYASTGNAIVLSTLNGAYFPDNQSTILINQPFGFVTLSVQPYGYYSILNTFAFPTGSESAYVYNINTDNIGFQDNNTHAINTLRTSTGVLYYNSSIVGDVTQFELNSSINNVIDLFNTNPIIRKYVAVGISCNSNINTTIEFSINTGNIWYPSEGSNIGFSNGGISVAANTEGFFVACGNNDNGGSSNLGFLQWSIDGIGWNYSISPYLDITQLRSRVFYASGVWNTIGLATSSNDSNSILWSKDGKIWNSSFLPQAPYSITGFTGITHGLNTWLTCGATTNIAYSLLYSTDGSNWNPNVTIPPYGNVVYDVAYTGSQFIALFSNINGGSNTSNILISQTGSNNWSLIPENFKNESGFLAANSLVILAFTTTIQKYSINGGYTWNLLSNFPSGVPSRPYYDGSVWWVGINNVGTSNIYVSIDGINNWTQSNITGVFPYGYPNEIVSFNTNGNLNFQLVSTVQSLQTSFSTSNISIGNFSIYNSSIDNLVVYNDNSNATVKINNLITSSIQTNTFDISIINICTFNVSTIYNDYINTQIEFISTLYFSTMYGSDINAQLIESSTLSVKDNLSASYIEVSSINVISQISSSYMVASTIDVLQIYGSTINAKLLINNYDSYLNNLYVSTVSSLTNITSTLQLIDQDGSLKSLYTNTNKLFFNGSIIPTQITNPLFFTYELFDITLATPSATYFSVNNSNLINVTKINLSTTDYTNLALYGLYNNLGLQTVLHIIDPNTGSDHMYRITKKVDGNDHFIFNLRRLVGDSQILNIGQRYNIYIGSIGIQPPPSPPTNIVSIKAKVGTTGFDFSSGGSLQVIPPNIGTYSPGSTDGSYFLINLNATSYGLFNIPAIVGTITYFTITSVYNIVNVKFGSISIANGATITIDQAVNILRVDGLSTTNFPASADMNNYSIYITLQFLN